MADDENVVGSDGKDNNVNGNDDVTVAHIKKYISYIDNDCSNAVELCFIGDSTPWSLRCGFSFSLTLLMFLVVYLPVYFIPSFVDQVSCVNGSSIKLNEEFVCFPEDSSSVVIMRQSTSRVKIYRANSSSPPGMTTFKREVKSSSNMESAFYNYVFPLVEGSTVSYSCFAEPGSTWFILDDFNWLRAGAGLNFTWLLESERAFQGFFVAPWTDTYHFVVRDDEMRGIYQECDLNLEFLLYDTSELVRDACNTATCKYDDVSPDDFFIVQAEGNDMLNVQILRSVGANALYTSLFTVMTFLLLVGSISCFSLFFYGKNKKKRLGNAKSPLHGFFTGKIHGMINKQKPLSVLQNEPVNASPSVTKLRAVNKKEVEELNDEIEDDHNEE